MAHEDLGKLLEAQLGLWVRDGAALDGRDSDFVDDQLQFAAEGFWNNVIAELQERVDPIDRTFRRWLEDQKIGDDE